jgi:LacI family transcriptional regulator
VRFDSITIKDIAKALAVSKSTVSRALQNAADIRPETKRLILEYAEKYKYRPNLMASSLKEGRSYSIGVVVSEIANPFFSQVIDGIESIAYKNGYRVIITQSRESPEREMINVEHLCSHSIDGLLISLSSATTDLAYLKKWQAKGLPMVLFDKISKEIKTHTVVVNNSVGAYDATECLIRRGYKNIAHLTAPPFLSITRERLHGYKEALLRHSLPFDKGLVRYVQHGENIEQEVKDALQSLFDQALKPEAILCATDRTTISCHELLEAQKERFGDVALAGFSNSSLFNHFPNNAVIVQQPAFEIGQRAFELLLQLLESKTEVEKFETKVLAAKLIVRN